VLNRVRQCILAFRSAASRRAALLAGVLPVLGKVGGDTVLAIAVLAVVLLAIVILAAVFSAKPPRRRAALAVLDRLLPWKAR
jgi:hypothetical protein